MVSISIFCLFYLFIWRKHFKYVYSDSFINERNRKKNIYDAEKAAIVSTRNLIDSFSYANIKNLFQNLCFLFNYMKYSTCEIANQYS